jgi:hypothetical protein
MGLPLASTWTKKSRITSRQTIVALPTSTNLAEEAALFCHAPKPQKINSTGGDDMRETKVDKAAHEAPNPALAKLIRELTVQRRWIRLTLAVGVAASVAANFLHTETSLETQLASVWPPLALLLAIEHVARRRLRDPRKNKVRTVALIVIAGICAIASYLNMVAYFHHLGAGVMVWLLPLSVDGLVVLASVTLFDITDELREARYAANTRTVADSAKAVGGAPASLPAAMEGVAGSDQSVAGAPDGRPSQARRHPAKTKLSPVPQADPAAPADTKRAVEFYRTRHGMDAPAIALVLGLTARHVRRYMPKSEDRDTRHSAA